MDWLLIHPHPLKEPGEWTYPGDWFILKIFF
jgi:hypothetical protein